MVRNCAPENLDHRTPPRDSGSAALRPSGM